MRIGKNIYVFLIGMFLLLTSFTVYEYNPVVQPQVEGGLAVVANGKGVPAEMILAKLKSVLKGEQQRWKDGSKVSLAFMKTSTAIGEDMTKRIFGMTAKELNKYILAQVFQGKMSSPQFFDSEDDLIKYVKSKEGAIGIISYKNATGTTTISIDGKKSI